MPQLHEILAVEGDLNSIAQRTIEESINTFLKKPNTYRGQVRRVTMLDPTREGENTVEDVAVTDTVASKLEYTANHFSRYIDVVLQKEQTNQSANADLVVDGTTIATGLPATFLLGLETRLKRIRDLYVAAPTLEPGLRWQLDENEGENIYTVEAKPSFKTEKNVKHKVLVEATKEHPAQIEKWNEDTPVGRIEVTHSSGMLTVAEKSGLLTRLDKLIRATKRARMQANQVSISERTIGEEIFNYLHA